MLRTLARNRIAIYRTSNEIVDPITPTTLNESPLVTVSADALNAQRIKSIVSISVSPQPAATTGSVRIVGTDTNDSSQTEDIDIPLSGVAQGRSEFKTVTEVTVSGSTLNNKTITIRYIGKDGGSIKARRTISSCSPAQISRGRGSFNAAREGTIQGESLRISVPYFCLASNAPAVREGDLIKDLDTNAEFIVTGAPLIQQVGVSRFYDITAQRYQGG
jgi:hypothetical protein